jgi:hypothetical protein
MNSFDEFTFYMNPYISENSIRVFNEFIFVWFGNPCIRAISKICASVMQITLKIKSNNTVQSLSPTLSLLEASDSWIMLMNDGAIRVSNTRSHNYALIWCTCSLMDTSHAPDEHKNRLVIEFIKMVLIESGRKLDQAEMWCMTTLVRYMVRQTVDTSLSLSAPHNKHSHIQGLCTSWIHCFSNQIMTIKNLILTMRRSSCIP